MSGILGRTVFYDNVNGDGIRFMDFAHCITKIGVMLEPFQVDDRWQFNRQFTSYNPGDMINKIDNMKNCNMKGKHNIMNFGSGEHIHEGMGLRSGP